jgi:hypothetical protein
VIENRIHPEAVVPEKELAAIPGPLREDAIRASRNAMSQARRFLARGSYSIRTALQPEEGRIQKGTRILVDEGKYGDRAAALTAFHAKRKMLVGLSGEV